MLKKYLFRCIGGGNEDDRGFVHRPAMHFVQAPCNAIVGFGIISFTKALEQ